MPIRAKLMNFLFFLLDILAFFLWKRPHFMNCKRYRISFLFELKFQHGQQYCESLLMNNQSKLKWCPGNITLTHCMVNYSVAILSLYIFLSYCIHYMNYKLLYKLHYILSACILVNFFVLSKLPKLSCNITYMTWQSLFISNYILNWTIKYVIWRRY